MSPSAVGLPASAPPTSLTVPSPPHTIARSVRSLTAADGQIARVTRPFGHMNRRREVAALQHVADHVDAVASGVAVQSGAGERIDDRNDTHDVWSPRRRSRGFRHASTHATDAIVASHAESCGPPDFAWSLPRSHQHSDVPLHEGQLRGHERGARRQGLRHVGESHRARTTRSARSAARVRCRRPGRRPLGRPSGADPRSTAHECAGASRAGE